MAIQTAETAQMNEPRWPRYGECSSEDDEAVLQFRPLQESDQDQIKSLHEELFPVEYSTEFYNNVVLNKTISGAPLFSRIAVVKTYDEESIPSLKYPNDALEKLAKYVDVTAFQDEEIQDTVRIADSCLDSLAAMKNGGQDIIIGCIVGAFVDISQMKDKSISSALIRHPEEHSRMFYIMTLGATQSFRKQKLGTKLVLDCIKIVEQAHSCGAIYLHVITYNTAAIKFYEKLGFYRLGEIKGRSI